MSSPASPTNPIREARKAKGLTLEQLGARIGTTRSAVCKYEAGVRMPRPRHAAKLVEVLGIEYADLYRQAA